MTQGGGGAIVGLVQVGDSGGLQEPGGTVVALVVTRKAREPRRVEPVEIVSKPFLKTCQFWLSESFVAGEEGKRLGNFCEMHGFDDALETSGLAGRNDLAEEKTRGHVGCGADTPGLEVGVGSWGEAGGVL